MNNPVNLHDSNGQDGLPNWAKFAIGVGIIAATAALMVATGGAAAGTMLAAVNCAAQGALAGAVTQGAIGAASGAITGAISHRITAGTWEGAGDAALDGAATGFMMGTITGAISGAITSPNCFVAGTTVLTAAGTVAIENIQIGDMVWAWDEETGEVGLKRVLDTYENETYELIHVFVNGEEIVTTPAHPFYSPVKGWTQAVHLRAGDILVLVNGEYVVVEKVQHEILESPVKVYNFHVEDYHTYYVTEHGVLVHNVCTNTENHHFLSNKNKRYTPQFKEITDQYGLNLNSGWNIRPLSGHRGRHTNAYHEYMLEAIKKIHETAKGNKAIFIDAFNEIIDTVITNPRIPYM